MSTVIFIISLNYIRKYKDGRASRDGVTYVRRGIFLGSICHAQFNGLRIFIPPDFYVHTTLVLYGRSDIWYIVIICICRYICMYI